MRKEMEGNQLINLTETNGQMVVSSREVATNFGKEHSKVVRSIENTIEGIAKSGDTHNNNILFIENEYISEQNNQKYKEYLLTRDGFSLIVMSFTGQKAMEWKLKYINAFNQMEASLKKISENPISLTTINDTKLIESIKDTLDEVKRVTMVLTHKQKLDLTKHILIPTIEMYGVKQENRKDVIKLVKENLILGGKWENIRIDDNFNVSEFKNQVRTCVEIIKKNNPSYFKDAEYRVINLFD